MPNMHLAQINVATAVAPLEDPRLADFVAQLAAVNALADRSPGFVWRLQADAGTATSIRMSDDPRFIVNMSVWATVEALFDYVYKSGHRSVMARRREWFERPDGAFLALWWIEAGTIPTVEDGLTRLRLLDERGATPEAFTFKTVFPPPRIAGAPRDLLPEPHCAGWR